MKTRNCMDCALADHTGERLVCTRGHKPRFYQPRGLYPWFENDWGWKRRCADFEKGTPKGIEQVKIQL